MIAQESIEEVKDRANLVELIGETVSLKRQGSSYVGRCPFHQEKTGSFHIREGGKFYHCFGCGASGNAISFYMQTKGVSFPQAVEDLAERFGVVLKFSGGRQEQAPKQDKNIFYEINKTAAAFFARSLNASPDVVRNYIVQRRLLPETLKAFAIGFSPVGWRALSDELKSKKLDEELLLAAGLCRRNSKGELYDFFRARLIFPIIIDGKRIAGFGGRLVPGLLDEEQSSQMPKYLNSADSPVYQKNKTLYGLPQAMQAIRDEGLVYVVEGYMDVIGLWQAGVKNVVATCGTALTSGHVKRLSFLTKRVHILFDGDSAGRNAASKAFSVFLNSGLEAKVLFLPENEDPDSIAGRLGEGTSAYLSGLARHSLLECYIDAIFSRYAVRGVKELGAALKGQVCEEVGKLLAAVKNPVERAELSKEAAFKLMIDTDLLEKSGGQPLPEISNEESNSPAEDQPFVAIKPFNELPRLDQEILLCVMVLKDEVSQIIINDPDVSTVLHPVTLTFIQCFMRLLKEDQPSMERKKESIKLLLREFGGGWLAHWKKAHEMGSDPRVDLRQSFNQCLSQVRKNKLNQSLIELDRFLQSTSDENLKMELFQRRIGLIKQINSILVLPQG